MNYETFEVGDLVEVISARDGAPVKVGDRGTVIATPFGVVFHGAATHVAVDYQCGESCMSRRDCIRKIKPPAQREATSTWDDVIVWRPAKTEVKA